MLSRRSSQTAAFTRHSTRSTSSAQRIVRIDEKSLKRRRDTDSSLDDWDNLEESDDDSTESDEDSTDSGDDPPTKRVRHQSFKKTLSKVCPLMYDGGTDSIITLTVHSVGQWCNNEELHTNHVQKPHLHPY